MEFEFALSAAGEGGHTHAVSNVAYREKKKLERSSTDESFPATILDLC